MEAVMPNPSVTAVAPSKAKTIAYWAFTTLFVLQMGGSLRTHSCAYRKSLKRSCAWASRATFASSCRC